MKRVALALAAVLALGASAALSVAGAAASRPAAPELFGEGVLSTEDDELGSAFSPDGKEIFFAKRTPATIQSSVVVICSSRLENGRWQRPSVAPFSGRFFDYSPSFSPDGSKLYFASVRPVGGQKRDEAGIWVVERQAGGWSEPRFLGPPIDAKGPDQNASVAADGTLYFASIREGGKGSFDIYRSRLVGGRYAEPENLGDAINSEAAEMQPYVAPDQSFLIFASLGRADAALGAGSPYPRNDLYASVQRDGKWTPAKRLPAPINTEATESYPTVSPDGRFLFFTSERNFTSIPMPKRLTYAEMQARLRRPGNGLGDLYRVALDAAGLDLPKKAAR